MLSSKLAKVSSAEIICVHPVILCTSVINSLHVKYDDDYDAAGSMFVHYIEEGAKQHAETTQYDETRVMAAKDGIKVFLSGSKWLPPKWKVSPLSSLGYQIIW